MLSQSGKELLLDESMTLADIQLEFSRLFPYLKLEFYTIRKSLQSQSSAKLLTKKLSEFNSKHLLEETSISPEMSVMMLEYNFHERFALEVQVFRKSGKSWLETTATGEWTLAEQNAEGEALGE